MGKVAMHLLLGNSALKFDKIILIILITNVPCAYNNGGIGAMLLRDFTQLVNTNA